MDGYIEIDEWFIPSLVHETRTMLLMGQTGSGKSATGNSILGRFAFKSRMSPNCVTNTVDCQTTTLTNGEIINVIDTPGLFDLGGIGSEVIFQEIMNCVELGRDGFHAVLLVCNVRQRFTEDHEGVIQFLQRLFGSKITDYMVLVFTGGDDFDEDESLEGYLALGSEYLQNIVENCKNRCVLFDNKTKDAKKKATQLHNLLAVVDNVIEANGAQAYTHWQEAANLQQKKLEMPSSKGLTNEELTVSIEQIRKSYDEQLMQLTHMFEKITWDAQKQSEVEINELKENLAVAEQKAEKLVDDALKETEGEARRLRQMMVETSKILQKQLDDERDARLKAEIIARDAQARFKVEICKKITKIYATMDDLL